MKYGMTGKILRIDLTDLTYAVEEPDEYIYRTYYGGSALACYYLLNECPKGTDPMGPDNLLIFASSPLVGSGIPGSNRYSVAAISPLSGIYGEAEAGGWWSPELKRAGYDAVLIKGKAEKPVYLWIHDGQVEIRNAGALWGKGTGDAQDIIKNDLGVKRVSVAAIGPAGENQVRFACVVNGLKHTNGRGGLGAVMGSKNLKAIAVRGKQSPDFHDKETLKRVIEWYANNFMDHPIERVLHDGGTIGWDVTELDEAGILPTYNFRSGSFEKADDICGETFHKQYFIEAGSCQGCVIRCKRVARSDGPYKVDPAYGGPEYETAAAFGSLCGVSDLEVVCKAHELCNKYTLDSISTGATIAFAMECFENGLLTAKDTDGLELKFGNQKAMVECIHKVANREGIGDLLAEGSRRASETIGGGAKKLAMHVKGQELAMHEPRGKGSLGLAYALSSTGANHTEGPHDYLFQEGALGVSDLPELGILEPVPAIELTPEKVRYFALMQLTWNVFNTLGLCIFTAGPGKLLKMNQVAQAVEAATGWNVTLWEIMKLAERTVTLKRAVSVLHGITRKDDCLPDRFFQPLEGGLLKGMALEQEVFEKSLDLYYDMRGWDRNTGIPTAGKLVELGLGWVNKLLGQQ
ncbi:MAG: aldehyde ferredoxin oxidoreductase family protein [Desulfobacterales bacterium]|nr:MAG: aldehyde ferredoxin oxidoreductase family protein [Desulfobacterales bacterium]